MINARFCENDNILYKCNTIAILRTRHSRRYCRIYTKYETRQNNIKVGYAFVASLQIFYIHDEIISF